ncbi:NADPH-dependent F420 reductase [Allobranchiibius sp. GilTou73]|uniref:NADPH-dependent F420 reductase n=1 Tax=Allobranchiibius sp. GilTou73 TaxID=2904523 RepID=UPI0021075226|nr:NAD(P)-binding domain-containing protein [Allobranchiibius sp. GilTou73]
MFAAHRTSTEGRIMRIGIIGAGNIGGALVRGLVPLGHDVQVANSRGPQTLQELASETGASAVTVQDAVKDKDLIVVTIPQAKIESLPAGLFADVSDDVVVVDTGNYYPRERDGRIAALESGTVESAWVQDRIGHPVVKAFNNIFAAHLQDEGQPQGADGRIALPIAGDDADAKKVVQELVDALGFDPVDAGSIADSWRQQPGTPVYTTDLDVAGVRAALADAPRERPEAFTATPDSPGSYSDPR